MASLPKVQEYDIQKQLSAMPDDHDVDEIVTMSERYVGKGSALGRRLRPW
jgi:hypothetical protein